MPFPLIRHQIGDLPILRTPTKLATVPTKARGWTRSSQGVDSRGDLEKKGQQQRLCGKWVSSRKTYISCLTLQPYLWYFWWLERWTYPFCLDGICIFPSFSGGYSSPLFGFEVAQLLAKQFVCSNQTIQLSNDSITLHFLFPSNIFPNHVVTASSYYCWWIKSWTTENMQQGSGRTTYHPQLMLRIYAINSSKNQRFSRIQVSPF